LIAFALGAGYTFWRPIADADEVVRSFEKDIPAYSRTMIDSVRAGGAFADCVLASRGDDWGSAGCTLLLSVVSEVGGLFLAVDGVERTQHEQAIQNLRVRLIRLSPSPSGIAV